MRYSEIPIKIGAKSRFADSADLAKIQNGAIYLEIIKMSKQINMAKTLKMMMDDKARRKNYLCDMWEEGLIKLFLIAKHQ